MPEQTESMSVFEEVRADQLARRREAAATLRAILLRADRPAKGDKEALPEVMGVLGLTLDDLASLKECVEAAVRYAGLFEEEEGANQAYRELHLALSQADQYAESEHARIDRELAAKKNAISAKLSPVMHKNRQIKEARNQAIIIAGKWISVRDGVSEDEARESLIGKHAWDQLSAM